MKNIITNSKKHSITLGLSCLALLLLQTPETFAQSFGGFGNSLQGLPSVSPSTPVNTLQTFLKIDGIQGESQARGHQNEIEVLGFSAGVELLTQVNSGASPRPQFSEVGVSKNVDKASPMLFVSCATGKRFPSATLTLARGDQWGVREFFRIVLTNVLITKVDTKAQAGVGGTVAEEVSLTYGKIQWTVTTYDLAGAPTVTSGGYDLSQR